MDPVSFIPVLPIVLLALITLKVVSKVVPISVVEGHYGSIDGLRGYLAFFVFLHHSSIWYYFIRYRYWGFPPSNLYSHFGPTSVAFFFMITAFLFFRKLMSVKNAGMDWLKLYVSRVLRILPLYWLVVMLLFVIMLATSGFQLFLPVRAVLFQMAGWLVFMSPDINGLGGTGIIVAGVVGSLAFEWFFYCSLALVGHLVFRLRTPMIALVGSTLFFCFFAIVIRLYYPHLALLRICCFSGGILAAFLMDHKRVRKIAVSYEFSLLMALLLGGMLYFYPSFDGVVPLICSVMVFIGIACGNTLFGILSRKISRQLGQVSYSIFMLHGIFLFVTFNFVIGIPQARVLSPVLHWGIIALIAVVLVISSVLSYTYIELPFMNAASNVTLRIRSRLAAYRTQAG